MIRELIELVKTWNDAIGQAVFLLFVMFITAGTIIGITALICNCIIALNKGRQP